LRAEIPILGIGSLSGEYLGQFDIPEGFGFSPESYPEFVKVADTDKVFPLSVAWDLKRTA